MQSRLEESLESASRSSTRLRPLFHGVRKVLKFMAAVAVVVCAYWNILAVHTSSENLPPRETEELTTKEKRLAPVRENLLLTDYKGEIAFITNRSLAGLPPTPEDNKRWSQSQYVL